MFRHGPRFTSFFAALCFLLAVACSSAQNIIHVPADQPSIQSGIDAASTGDTILVAPGTYNENIDFKGKSITVTSAAGASATFLNGLVNFNAGEPRTAVLNGFTFENLTGTIVDISLSSPTVSNNAFLNDKGCAVAIANSSASPRIVGNRIFGLTLGPTSSCGSGFTPTGTAIGVTLERVS